MLCTFLCYGMMKDDIYAKDCDPQPYQAQYYWKLCFCIHPEKLVEYQPAQLMKMLVMNEYTATHQSAAHCFLSS